MPIQLDALDTAAAAVKNAVTPKFFNMKLTGSGKKIGLLNEHQNPMLTKPEVRTTYENIRCRKQTYTNGPTTITTMPLAILDDNALTFMSNIKIPDISDMVCVNAQKNENVYVRMCAHSLILEETKKSDNSWTKVLTPCYRLEIYVIKNTNDQYAVVHTSHMRLAQGNVVYITYTCNPLEDYNKDHIMPIVNVNIKSLMTAKGVAPDDAQFYAYLNDFSLYDAVIKAASEWQESADVILDEFFEQAAKTASDPMKTHQIPSVVKHIADYNIPLELYKNIYTSIYKHFKADGAAKLCKLNLNLLLSDTLNNLDKNKSKLHKLPTPKTPVAVPSFYSIAQKSAITSTEPLILVQAGAGTGKSSTIKARINYMVDCGVNPEDITVLSFTNAAADHITEICPTIHSMTIARMVHNIYSTNFPAHELSSIDTIINSLDIYYPNNDFAYNFAQKLWGIVKNEPNAFVEVNNFVEKHYDEVIDALTTIKQTCLELEIIICYQKIETLNEPSNVTSKYLIVDEVQDNSIFEFIYTLKYTDKHLESLFIVGRLQLPTLTPTNCGKAIS